MKQIVKGITRELRKNFERIGYEHADVEIEIDVQSIAQWLGHRALSNRTGKSSFMHGYVKVKVLRRETCTD